MFINYNVASFLTSSVDSKCINIADKGMEIAFLGYSNSGKSSLINCITNKNNLAYSSKKPGSTKMINFFKVNSNLRLVDLPGYGYSSTFRFNNIKLYNLIFSYLKHRKSLRLLILLIDIRRLIRPIDKKFLNLFYKKKDIIIVLTKYDKISKNFREKQLIIFNKQLFLNFKNIPFFFFSSIHKIDINKILNKINNSYENFFNIS